MPEGMPPGYTTAFHDDRRTVEILHRNQVEKLDHDRRIQYDTLAQDFMVSLNVQLQSNDTILRFVRKI